MIEEYRDNDTILIGRYSFEGKSRLKPMYGFRLG